MSSSVALSSLPPGVVPKRTFQIVQKELIRKEAERDSKKATRKGLRTTITKRKNARLIAEKLAKESMSLYERRSAAVRLESDEKLRWREQEKALAPLSSQIEALDAEILRLKRELRIKPAGPQPAKPTAAVSKTERTVSSQPVIKPSLWSNAMKQAPKITRTIVMTPIGLGKTARGISKVQKASEELNTREVSAPSIGPLKNVNGAGTKRKANDVDEDDTSGLRRKPQNGKPGRVQDNECSTDSPSTMSSRVVTTAGSKRKADEPEQPGPKRQKHHLKTVGSDGRRA